LPDVFGRLYLCGTVQKKLIRPLWSGLLSFKLMNVSMTLSAQGQGFHKQVEVTESVMSSDKKGFRRIVQCPVSFADFCAPGGISAQPILSFTMHLHHVKAVELGPRCSATGCILLKDSA
jgi:hypothetical protein